MRFALPGRNLPAFSFLLLLSPFAHAATHLEVQAGRSYMDNHGTNTVFVEAVFAPRALGHSRFTWSPDMSVGWIDGRHLARYENAAYGTRPTVSLVAAGARFRTSDGSAWYRPLFFSFQVAGTNHVTQALSSHYQFVSTLGYAWKHVSFALRHISNGSLHEPNRGETMALLGVGFDL